MNHERIQSILTDQFLQTEYVQKEKSVRQIATKTGYVNSTILTYLEKFNIKRRTISEFLRYHCTTLPRC